MKNLKASLWLLLLLVAISIQTQAQQISSPKTHFGFEIGDDYQLANFEQTERYFKKLSEQSDRVIYQSIGKTEEGRDQCMLIISSPENLKNLEKYKQISSKLARAEMTEQEARNLSKDGKSVVWIDGGLHSTEVVGMHQLIQTAYLLASAKDAETEHILQNSIILLVHANPDGQDLVSNWYMREKEATKRSTSLVPVLYQKYAGHDNNRDFFMLNLKESQNMARQLFVEWVPQIMYNHHQTAPAGAVVAGAPYRDPFNYVFDPLLMSGIDALGAAMSSRLNAENKPGYTAKGGSVFSTWYNGGLRTTTYFHNMIGLLTEIIGNPTPYDIPLVPSRLIPSSNTQNPVVPQRWHFRQSIDYSISLNYAVMGYAARYRDEVLYNIYRMGRNSIEKGSKDTWSLSPSKVAIVEQAVQDARKANPNERFPDAKLVNKLYEDKTLRDPRAYVIPSDQADFNTAVKFLNALIGNGIEVMKATAEFTVAGKSYPEGSFIVKTNQAFRPHILDMFEPQDHPDDFEYPGGPPIPPYDAAGWTLAYIMNVKFDRFLDDINGPFQKLTLGDPIILEKKASAKSKFLSLPAANNDSYKIVNSLLNNKQKVWRDQDNGNFYIANNNNLSLNVPSTAINAVPKSAKALKPLRIALWDSYGGSMPSGWIRFLMEQFDYNATVVFPPDIDKGNLKEKFDVIILPGGAIPRFQNNVGSGYGPNFNNAAPQNIPSPYRERWGRLTAEQSIPVLRDFMEKGGTIVSIGNSIDIAKHFNLGITEALVDANNKALRREVFYTPGSVLKAKIANNLPDTWGYNADIDVYYSNSALFKINDPQIKPLIWFDSDQVLKSGWSWGEKYLKDAVLAFDAKIGKGKLVCFGNDITFRAQTHGTFKFLFNQLY
ncbi:M14 family metallopeptidase [Sphingobacterium sp. BN32]|uniref:M14 family metallopeptidase n=1 Tax=Sphingobacterium sp. BN32 TaxID=3058432 RepID=UPI00265D045E|nr:M14 family metallopeptidase [Sphingobacterium sp. BN32]WKK57296.1 M14 family metallopeptidase [Sphingobacterium sp. BN32]